MNRKKVIQILTSLAVLGCLLPAHAANVHIPSLIELLLLKPKIVSTTYIFDDLWADGGVQKYDFLTTDEKACALTILFSEPFTPFSYKIQWIDPDDESLREWSQDSNMGAFVAVGIEDCIDIADHFPAGNPGTWGVKIFIDGDLSSEASFQIEQP